MYMASIGNPRTWVPYINREDCSQGFCSLNCPQWCYIIFPPPPPLEFPGNKDSSSSFSPFLIAIVGILASAFLLPWGVVNSGLEEGLIKSISVCKYKKGSGLIEGTECSVCLNEFQDGENLRLLPKCPHAFHVNCIDTWLRSHSSCPLCRSDITYLSSPLPPPTDPATGDQQNRANGSDAAEDNGEINVEEMEGEENEGVVVIEIHEEGHRGIRRSFSMDGSSTIRSLRVADILQIDDDQEEVGELSNEKAVKHYHAGIKRSFSSGRLRLAG